MTITDAQNNILLLLFNQDSSDVTPISIELLDNDGAFLLDNDGTQLVDNG